MKNGISKQELGNGNILLLLKYITKGSTDYIGLNLEIIKHVILNIAKLLCYINNKSFLDGTFPDKMKNAKIISIYKSGHKNLICNYIPISLLSKL